MQNKFTVEEAKEAIKYLNQRPVYSKWTELLWSLRSEFTDSETLDIALSRWSDEKPNETKKVIDNYDSSKRITIGTFIKEAQNNGYVKPSFEPKQTSKPKKVVNDWTLRLISNKTNRFLGINQKDYSLRKVNSDDIKEIKKVLGKSFTIESFEKIDAKICISPYGIAFPPKIDDVSNIETDETLWIEGKTGLLTALTIGLDSHFNIAYRHNVSSKVKSSTKVNYAMLDNDDIDQFKKSIELKDGHILFEVRPPVQDKKDFADWIHETNISSAEVKEYIHKNKIEVLQSIDQICSKFEMTDKGNSDRLVLRNKEDILYNYNDEFWHIWDGRIWARDNKKIIQELAKTLTESIKKEVEYLAGDDAKKRSKWALHSGSLASITNSIKLATSDSRISVGADHFDKQNHLLNLENGFYDLRIHKFSEEHKKEHLFTLNFPVKYDPEAKFEKFNEFLYDIFAGDLELTEFVQRCMGLALSGETPEALLVFGYGKGKNGKSIFKDVMEMLFGDYAILGDNDLLISKHNSGDSNPKKAILKGKRFSHFSEIPENGRLNEASVKDLTGGDTIKARFLYKTEFSFKPTHSVWAFGNHKPKINGTDDGIWRRIYIIPFLVTISEEKRRPREELLSIFKSELSGILNYCIEGYKDYQQNGLNPPDVVLQAIEEYKAEQDKVSEFIAEKCKLGSKLEINIKLTTLHTVYTSFCKEREEIPYKSPKFADTIIDRSEGKIEKKKKNNAVWLYGIGLNEEPSQTNIMNIAS